MKFFLILLTCLVCQYLGGLIFAGIYTGIADALNDGSITEADGNQSMRIMGFFVAIVFSLLCTFIVLQIV
jgi:hypothetical protein